MSLPAPRAVLGVVLADDNAVVRMGLTALLGNAPDLQVLAEASDGEAAVAAVHEHRPDVLLLDVRMPGRLDGVAVAREVAELTAVVMLTYSEQAAVVQAALQAGARGFLVHGDTTPEQLVDAVRAAAAGTPVFSPRADAALVELVRGTAAPLHHGGQPSAHAASAHARPGPPAAAGQGRLDPLAGLSPREREILDLLAEGLDNTAVAGQLFISRHTLKNHITRIFTKLGVRTRSEAVALSWQSRAR